MFYQLKIFRIDKTYYLNQIVKYEWTTTWRDFISQICNASKADQNLCENNLTILKILSEEVIYKLIRFLIIQKIT